MTPEKALDVLIEILLTHPDFTEDEIYEKMVKTGVPGKLADRAYKFTQIAWGRLFLGEDDFIEATGITFSPDYVCLDAAGNIIESGKLANEPSFRAAYYRVKEHHVHKDAFRALAVSSADFRGVNDALIHGSKIEEIVIGLPCLFMEVPTKAGLERSGEIIAQYLSAKRAGNQTKMDDLLRQKTKSWWQFW